MLKCTNKVYKARKDEKTQKRTRCVSKARKASGTLSSKTCKAKGTKVREVCKARKHEGKKAQEAWNLGNSVKACQKIHELKFQPVP